MIEWFICFLPDESKGSKQTTKTIFPSLSNEVSRKVDWNFFHLSRIIVTHPELICLLRLLWMSVFSTVVSLTLAWVTCVNIGKYLIGTWPLLILNKSQCLSQRIEIVRAWLPWSFRRRRSISTSFSGSFYFLEYLLRGMQPFQIQLSKNIR